MKLNLKDFRTLLLAADVADAQMELMDSKRRSKGRMIPTNRLTGTVLAAVATSATLVLSMLKITFGYEAPSTYLPELPERSSVLAG